jgi:hypothetical protein
MASPYDLALHISMSNGVTPVLAIIAKDLLGLQMSASKLEGILAKVGTALKIGAGGMAAVYGGVEIFKGLEHIANKGEELIHQQNLMQRNGISYNAILDYTQTAYSQIAKAVPTANAVDILRITNELVSVKGTLEGAQRAITAAAKIEAVVGNATGRSAEGQGYDVWRATEDKGIIQDAVKTAALQEQIVKAINATGAKLTGSNFFSYSRRAMSSWITDSPESFPLQVMQMQTLGADTAGVQRRMFGRMIEGGQKLSKKQIAAWEGIGMLDHGAVVGREIESTDPQKFIPKVIAALESHKIAGLEATKLWAQTALNASSSAYFLNAYTGMTERDVDGKTRLDKETENIRRAQGLSSYETMIGRPGADPMQKNGMRSEAASENVAAGAANRGDYKAVMKSLTEQFDGLMAAIGGPVAKAAIPVMQQLTSIFTSLGGFANANPQVMTFIAEGAAALGAALIGLGSVAVIGAAIAIVGPVTAAITGIGLALTALAAFNWSGVEKIFSDIATAVSEFYNKIVKLAGPTAQASNSLDPQTLVAKDYGDRKTLYHDNLEQAMEASRAKSLSKLPIGDIEKQFFDGASQGTKTGMDTGAHAAQPIVQAAVNAGTSSGVVAGVQAASGTVRGIVQSWFAGLSITPNISGGSAAPHSSMASATGGSTAPHSTTASLVPKSGGQSGGYKLADVYMDHQKVGRVVERGIAMNNRAVNTAAGHDGRADWAPPDVAFS